MICWQLQKGYVHTCGQHSVVAALGATVDKLYLHVTYYRRTNL